jgi:uncharacterized membrane protein YgdD (TMEM256/DUF423 family)
MDRLFLLMGSIAGLLAVATGAFGGHLLKERLSEDLLAIFEVGVRYHTYHALALLGAAWAANTWPSVWTTAAGWAFAAGIVLFSGSLYLLSLSGMRWFGAITPLGGLCFMAGWLCLAIAAIKAV